MKIMQVFLNRFSLIRSCSLCLQFAFVVAAFSPVGETATAQENVITSHERRNDVLEAHALTLPAPIQRWDNALPLGNGLIGGLLWGEGRELRLSLDRGDLWDERGNHDVYDPRRNFQTLLLAVEKRDRETWERYFDATYNKSKWTKIPGGRLVITLPEGISTETFHLDFREALATVELTRGEKASAFFSATDRIALLRVPYGSRFAFVRPESIDKLGYPPPQIVSSDQSISYTQKTAEDLVFNFTVKWQKAGDELLVAIATATNTETRNPELKSVLDATRALVQGWTRLRDSNTSWWKNFYNASAVTIPLPRLQHHYNLVKYLYGSASRSYANPMPLQGIWTADEGGLPPWKGDYHNDLNTQMTYVAWQAAGLVDSGMSYLNYYVDRMPQFREYGRSFFGLDGAMIPGVMTLRGQAMGGWPQYAMGLTAGLWNGHAFYQYWKTYQDDDFLGGNPNL
ncbi:MAG: glycoside hydrolase N-terminal domain-containing protein [Verrucomicrobiae bacterium]|nr:glycoside hydrolase N-terminal domain-containing protein [Verrucomicrobiae bacterium]